MKVIEMTLDMTVKTCPARLRDFDEDTVRYCTRDREHDGECTFGPAFTVNYVPFTVSRSTSAPRK
jgi:hypothetical protein